MNRVNEQRDEELIDLGAVSVETKGPVGINGDENGRLAFGGGLSNE
jgi:hypothetical protein